MDKILVIRLSSLGDILLATPVLRGLSKRFPFAKIDFLTKTQYAPLIDQNPYISRIIKLEKGDLSELLSLRKMIRSEYDLVVDLHRNLRTLILVPFLFGPSVTRFPKHSIRRILLTRFKINLLKKTLSVPERYLKSLEKYGVPDDGMGLDFFASPRSVIQAKDILLKHHLVEKEPVALAPGARWYTKRWPAKRFIELIELLPNNRFVVMGEESEKELGEELVKAFPNRVINFMGKTGLPTSGEVLRRCRAIVTNDTGLMHLGTAVKIPVVAIFGSTKREFGFFPFRAKNIVLEKPLSCRPCTAIGLDKCKNNTLECLEGISASEVADALKQIQITESLPLSS